MDPMTIAALGGMVSSLFGPKPKYTEGQKIQLDMARRMRNYATGIPGSDPQEQAQLAQLRGQLGAEQGQQTGQVLGALPDYARTNTGDLMANMASGQAAERSNLDLSAMMDWVNQRRQAMLGAAQVAGSVGMPQMGAQQNNVPQLMGQLAQLYAQQQAMKAQAQPQATPFITTPQPPGPAGGSIAGGWGGHGVAAPAALSVPMGGPTDLSPPEGGGPVMGQSIAAGPSSGAPGVLGPVSGASAAPALKPLQNIDVMRMGANAAGAASGFLGPFAPAAQMMNTALSPPRAGRRRRGGL